ncbi:MAG TPA: substrate-binding domain-containing protein [Opitutaceae bacterium]|nr:substrate-binding domain-containing protein [Opitutaceae bacterium]
MRVTATILGAMLCAFGANAALHAGESSLRVVGTDLLGVEFSRAIYDFAARHGIRTALALDGSRPGLDELCARRAEVALLMLPPEEETALDGFAAVVVAHHGVFVVAAEDCPLERITCEQLAGIFGAGPRDGIVRWSQLGVTGKWAEDRIAPRVPEIGSGIAVDLFRHVVLRDGELGPTVAHYRDLAELERPANGAARLLALASRPPREGAGLKIIAVAARPHDAAVLPTPETLQRGEYPLRLPLRVVFRPEALAHVRPLLEFLMGEGAAPHFERAGLTPLPAPARVERLAEVAKM